jgi:hypothetical protein
LLGPDGSGNAAIIEALIPMLEFSAAAVKMRHRTPPALLKRQSSGLSEGGEFSAEARAGSFVSIASVVRWLMRDLLDQFTGRKNLTLGIGESCYEDLLIDPGKYRYGGPMWFARLAGKFFPSPDLWIMMDPAPDGLPSRNHEVFSARKHSQLGAYRGFAKAGKKCVIVDASQPADRVVEAAYSAIVDTLAERTLKTLKSRF